MDLREYLFQNSLTIAGFARELGVSRIFLHNCMKGIKRPSKEKLEMIGILTKGKITTFEQLIDKRLNEKKNPNGNPRERKG